MADPTIGVSLSLPPAAFREAYSDYLVKKPSSGLSSRDQTATRTTGAWGDFVDESLLALHTAAHQRFSVLDYGARPGGTYDATEAIADTLAAAAAAGAVATIDPGIYRVDSSIAIPPGVGIDAKNAVLRLPDGADFAAFDMDGVTDVSISGVRVTCVGNPGSNCRGFYVRGSSERIGLTNCVATGLGNGFDIRGANGSTPGTARQVTLVACYSTGALRTFGFNVADAEIVEFFGCHASYNYLDGFKITARTKNIHVFGGSSRYNGQHPSEVGDGIDTFAGGDTFILDGLVCEYNEGNGIVIKTDSLNRDAPATYGYVRSILVNNVQCRYNAAHGMGIYVFTGSGTNAYNDSSGTPSIPMPRFATVNGGVFENNALIGMFLNGMGVVCNGPIVRRNGEDGIEVGVRSMWTTINDPILVANGQAETAYNMYLRGRHIRVVRPQFFGVDPDVVRTEADITGTPTAAANLTTDTLYGYDIEVLDPSEDPSSAGSITTGETDLDTRIVFHQSGTGTPATAFAGAGVRGGIGSTWTQTDYAPGGTPRIAKWLKVSGAPNNPAVGWRRMTPRATALTSSNFVLDASWGTGASVSVDSGSTDRAWRATITAGTGVTSGARCDVTFADGAYDSQRYVRVQRNGGNGSATIRADWSAPAPTSNPTGFYFYTVAATPVAGATYTFEGGVIEP